MLTTLFALICGVVATVVVGVMIVPLVSITRSERLYEVLEGLWAALVLRSSRVRVLVEGVESIDRDRSYVFIVNHMSLYDIPTLIHALPGHAKILAKKELFGIPIFGSVLRTGGHIRVDRYDRRSALDSYKAAQRALKRGNSIIVFAEGTRSRDGAIGDFKKGGFVMAIKSGTPIVPVTISGSYEIMQKGRLRLKPGTVRIRLFEPIPTADLAYGNRDELVSKVRDIIVGEYEKRQRTDPDHRSAAGPRGALNRS